MNKVMVIGRTTSDIELKTTSTGKAVCNFTLAVPRKWGKKDENGKTITDFFNPEFEQVDRAGIEALQLERLKATVKHCYEGSKFYKERFDSIGIKPEDIHCLDDLKKIPFTTKQDLRDTYPFGIASVSLDKCVRLHSSSGTTGNPTVILHTLKDLEQWANAVARCLWMVGCRPEDVFQNTSGYGMFTGGLGFQYGAEKLGMLTVPAAAGNTLRQIKFFTDFGTTVVHAIPSYGRASCDGVRKGTRPEGCA